MALDLDVIGKTIGPLSKPYAEKDVVLYALGVGAGFDELSYVYENQLKVIPSFSIAAIFDFLAEVGITSKANLAGILHGEQDLVFHNPIPPSGELVTTGTITDIFDKGRDTGALVVARGDTFHSDGQKLFTNSCTIFCRKDGGFGGEPGPSESLEFPDRPPDFEERAHPQEVQPLLYRLSGDRFALHVDPEFARASGFDKPIMHGLCTHGFACRAAIRHLFPGQPERMTRFRVRFSKTLYPGVPIRTQIWLVGEHRALFRTINEQTGEVALDRGIVEWIDKETLELRQRRGAIRFDDQVAVVTGAGAGLGKAYALELARRGAKVVVNDLGGSADGTGAGSRVADQVVAEIEALGGEAVASYDSVATVEGGEAIVNKALEAFGRIDVLINNAGILRDKSLTKMEPEAWRAIRQVHLDGAYHVTRPAFIKMREQGYGRIVMTSSAAGLFGNFGQANYAAAKMGLVGLMNALKLEGDKYGVKVNTIAPIAATRLTEDILPPEYFAKLKPEFVVPLVLYLCTEQCPSSGNVLQAGLGYFDRVALVSGPGAVVGDGEQPPTPEAVAKAIGKICALDDPEIYASATEALGAMLDAFSPQKQAAEPAGAEMTVEDVFRQMPQAFLADQAQGVEVVFQFEISGPGGGQWYSIINQQACDVSEGQHDAPTTTIAMSADDFLALIGGRLNPMQAYTTGKLKIKGDLMKSQLIEKLFRF